MPFTDRSRTELDWTCRRARFWGYEWEGVGLAAMQTPRPLLFGGSMAEETAKIKIDQPWTADAFTGEDKLLAIALLTGYEQIVWPRWKRDYTVISVEEEQPLDLGEGLIYNARPDTITKRKADGSYWYGPEDKTTGYLDSLLSYANSIQVHATAVAIEANKPGVRIAGALIQGLYKGFEKKDWDGGKGEARLFHPLVYAYVKEGRAGIVPDQWSVKWVRGWERTATTYYPGGVTAWIAHLKPEELAGVFPNSEPVTIKRPLVEQYLKQVVIREREIEAWRQRGRREDELDTVFPQSFSQCDGFGKGKSECVFKPACFTATARKFPLTFYKHRIPHHANELEALKGSIE